MKKIFLWKNKFFLWKKMFCLFKLPETVVAGKIRCRIHRCRKPTLPETFCRKTVCRKHRCRKRFAGNTDSVIWAFSDEFADKFVHKVEAIVTIFLIERSTFPSWLPFHFVNNAFHSIPFHLEVFAFVVKNVYAIKDRSRIQALNCILEFVKCK